MNGEPSACLSSLPRDSVLGTAQGGGGGGTPRAVCIEKEPGVHGDEVAGGPGTDPRGENRTGRLSIDQHTCARRPLDPGERAMCQDWGEQHPVLTQVPEPYLIPPVKLEKALFLGNWTAYPGRLSLGRGE